MIYKKNYLKIAFKSLAILLFLVSPLYAQEGLFQWLEKEYMTQDNKDPCFKFSTSSSIARSYPGRPNTCYACPTGSTFNGDERNPQCSTAGTRLSHCYDKPPKNLWLWDSKRNICLYTLS